MLLQISENYFIKKEDVSKIFILECYKYSVNKTKCFDYLKDCKETVYKLNKKWFKGLYEKSSLKVNNWYIEELTYFLENDNKVFYEWEVSSVKVDPTIFEKSNTYYKIKFGSNNQNFTDELQREFDSREGAINFLGKEFELKSLIIE